MFCGPFLGLRLLCPYEKPGTSSSLSGSLGPVQAIAGVAGIVFCGFSGWYFMKRMQSREIERKGDPSVLGIVLHQNVYPNGGGKGEVSCVDFEGKRTECEIPQGSFVDPEEGWVYPGGSIATAPPSSPNSKNS